MIRQQLRNKYSMEEILSDGAGYNIALLREHAEKRACKGGGGDFRFNTVKTVANILESLNRKLDRIESLLVGVEK